MKVLSNKEYQSLVDSERECRLKLDLAFGNIETMKSEYREIRDQKLDLETENENLQKGLVALTDSLKKAKDELVKEREIISNTNTVVISINDDLLSATPTVKYNPAIIEKLVQEQYLNDASLTQDPFAIQLALMEIARDVINQITDSFTENVSGN